MGTVLALLWRAGLAWRAQIGCAAIGGLHSVGLGLNLSHDLGTVLDVITDVRLGSGQISVDPKRRAVVFR